MGEYQLLDLGLVLLDHRVVGLADVLGLDRQRVAWQEVSDPVLAQFLILGECLDFSLHLVVKSDVEFFSEHEVVGGGHWVTVLARA